MKILVTGANSLLGTNLLVELLKNNYQVKGMVRSKNKINVSHPNLEVVLGDIRNKEAVAHAISGCDIVIHTAANTSQSSLRYEEYKEVNVRGSENVMRAAKKAGVKRVIAVSSANAFAYGTRQNPGTESLPIKDPFDKANYARSKYEAQLSVLQMAGELDLELIVVNPTFMIGKYDAKPSSGSIITRGYKKKWIFAPPGGKNFVHVRDVAIAICHAINEGKPGSCYLLAHENMSYKTFYKKLLSVTGQKSRIVILPEFLLLGLGRAGTWAARLGISNPMLYMNMKILCVKNYYSNNKAVRELGLPETPVAEAISDAVDWFLKKGMLKD